MSDWDDLDGVTPRISDEDAERLLSGTPGIDGAPDLADLSTVLGALRGPTEPDELKGLHSALVAFGAVAAFGAADVTAQSVPPTARTRPMFKKLLTGKALAAIGVVTLVSAGAAAAAGVVPTPFSAPRPSLDTTAVTDESTDDTEADDTVLEATPTTDDADDKVADTTLKIDDADDATDDTEGQGPDATGPAKFGLCTAYAARTKHDDTTTTEAVTEVAEPTSESEDGDLPVPFQNLTDAAEAASQTVAEFCADATPGNSADAPGHSGDNPSATAPGHSEDKPGGDKSKSDEDHGRPDTTHP